MPRLSLAVRVVIAYLLILMPLGGLDQWFYDQLFRISTRQKQASPFILLRVSDRKIRQLLETEDINLPTQGFSLEHSGYPVWHQAFYARLISIISAADPKLVVFTPFYEWVDQRNEKPMTYEKVVFASFVNDEGKLLPPPTRLTLSTNYGFNNLFPDRDNTLRQAPLVYSSGKSLALETYLLLKNEPPPGNIVDPIWIDFRGPAGSFPSFDAWDIYQGEIPSDIFKNKIVLIGREGSPASDIDTPLGRMPELEVHANVIGTYLENRQIRFLSTLTQWIIAILTVSITIGIVLYFPLSYAWVLVILFSLFAVATGWFSLKFLKVWVGVATPVASILGTHLVLMGFKISRQEEQQWRIQEESRYLKEMDQFKNNFISLFSHDLKTPIAKIKAITERLIAENPDMLPSTKEGLRSIDRTNTELARFISDILRVTKMESMALEPSKEVVDINRLIEVAAQRLKFLSDEKKIQVVLDLEPLFSMEGDPQLLQEVITNLVENAIKYSDENSKVVIQSREEESEVKIRVIDQGQGIPPEELPRITSKFFRGKSAEKKAKGSGLGLYLTKYFVELHKGRLAIDSQLGQGTKVEVSLPI